MRLKKLPGLCEKMEMPAVAVTDTNSMFSALEFSVTASGAGVQPIMGCQVDLTYVQAQPGEKPKTPAPLVLLAQSETGYENLMKLSTCLYVDKGGQLPQVTLEELADRSEGLICLSGGPDGPVGMLLQQGQRPAAEALVDRLAAMFPNRFYIELQRHPGEDGQPEAERLTERGHVEMAYAKNLPLVATNDVYFPTPDMYEAHDALICISEGAYVDQQEGRRRLTAQHYFKSQQEMATLFADLPEAIENTVEIARRCAFMAYRRDPILPKFADDEVAELRRIANEGLQKRLAVIPHAVTPEEYRGTSGFRTGHHRKHGFPRLLSDRRGFHPMGQGSRHSGRAGAGLGRGLAGGLCADDHRPRPAALQPAVRTVPEPRAGFYARLRHRLLHGSPRRGDPLCSAEIRARQGGSDHHLRCLAVQGRRARYRAGAANALWAGGPPVQDDPGRGVKPVSIEKALKDEPRLREAAREEEVVDRLLTYGQQVEGLLRNASTHAAGVVIGDRPLDALVPIYQDPRSDMPATQFNMKWVEQAGLVKFDFLGLKTLTVIQNAMDLIFKSGRPLHIAADGTELYEPAEGAENQINAIPLDDEATYKLYSAAKTVAVFRGKLGHDGRAQAHETHLYRGHRGACGALSSRPDGEHPHLLRGQERPAPDPIRSPADRPHPRGNAGHHRLPEQVMQIAQVMAGYSLGGADLLRRAMGKKIKEAMDAERPKFEAGAAKNGVDAKKASEVFDLLEKFANYGFNKSHAAAYAVVSYQTGWLKANHPVEFMAGVMNCDIHLTDKLAVYFEEVRKGLGLPYVPPCVNRSLATFDVVDGQLVYALGALKNVGVEAMNLVVQGRGDKPFVNLFDFARRVDLKKVGKRPLEMLARAGAFDELDKNRRRVFESLDRLVQYSAAIHEQKNSNQVSLFGEAGDDLPEPRLSPTPDWLPAERLSEEFKAIGFYLSGHPLDDYMPALKRKQVLTLDEVTEKARSGPLIAKMAGVVAGRQERKSAKGNRFAFVQMSDPTGAYEVTLFSDTLEKCREFLETGAQVVLTAEATMEADQLKLLGRSVGPADSLVAEAGATGLQIYVDEAQAVPTVAKVLEDAASAAKGAARGPVQFMLLDPSLPGDIEMELGREFPINPQIKGAIKSLEGVMTVEEI